MIPKTIHYIWLGGNPKPALVNICILSWKEKMPDYQIIEWNETNLDLDKFSLENRFFAKCRKYRMWAFVSDYLRLKILYQYGGIYLDTDMQAIKSFTPLMDDSAFIGMENSSTVSCGIIACCAQNSVIKKVLDYYDHQIWEEPLYTIPSIFTQIVHGQESEKIFTEYPAKFFYPFAFGSTFGFDCLTDNSYTVHWWAGSWTGKVRDRIFLFTKHVHNPVLKVVVLIMKAANYYGKSRKKHAPEGKKIRLPNGFQEESEKKST